MHEAPSSDGWNDGMMERKDGSKLPHMVLFFWKKKQFEDLEIED